MDTQAQPASPTPQPQEQTPEAPASSWLDTIQDADMQAFARNKGWKDPIEAVNSYINLEKFTGAEKSGRGVVIPKDDATPEEWNAYYNKIGRPESPENYELPMPDGDSGEFASQMSKLFHDAGIPKAAAQKLAEGWNQMQAEQQSVAESQAIAQEQTLKKEWGNAFDQNIHLANNAARQFGISPEQVDNLQKAMGVDGALKFLHNIGSKIGDDVYISGASNNDLTNAKLTPAQAKAEYNAFLQNKDKQQKYQAGDAKIRAEIDNILQQM